MSNLVSVMPRDGGQRLHVYNSGLEVWLYDDANLATIKAQAGPADEYEGAMPTNFSELTRQGLMVGYSLCQDDELDVEVHVGEPFTPEELAAGRWLEPQTAFLKLPSGKLCVESNDASRAGYGAPTDQGAVANVPPGDYRVTLYRVDHEALDRDGIAWAGPQEVILLTAGGQPHEAAADLLPFEQRRDLDWVGKYRIEGARADALIWFGDYWDTFILNLDSAAVKKLGLTPGKYFRAHAPAAGLTLLCAYGSSWKEAQTYRPPAGENLDEYGYAAVVPLGDWDGAEALFCRRQQTKTRAEDAHQNLWLPATVEVLSAEPLPRPEGRTPSPANLAEKQYFDDQFLGMVLGDLLPGADDEDEYPLPKALKDLGKKLDKLGLKPLADLEWLDVGDFGSTEWCSRVYAGPESSAVALVLATESMFEMVFVTEFDNGTWRVTGLADDLERLLQQARTTGVENQAVQIESVDEKVSKIEASHRKAVTKAKQQTVPPPTDAEGCQAFLTRFLKACFG